MGVSEIGVPFKRGPFKGILFYLGNSRGTPILGNAHMQICRNIRTYSYTIIQEY